MKVLANPLGFDSLIRGGVEHMDKYQIFTDEVWIEDCLSKRQAERLFLQQVTSAVFERKTTTIKLVTGELTVSEFSFAKQ